MKIITISRECGAGGGEVARRLAETLGWELLDRGALHRAADIEPAPEAERASQEDPAAHPSGQRRLTTSNRHYLHLLRRVVEQAAARGNVVLVGRGTRQLLAETPHAFHLRLVAPQDWRVRRLASLDNMSCEESLARCLETDRVRDHFHRYYFGSKGAQPSDYDAVVNTSRVSVDDVVALVAATVRGEVAGATGPLGVRRVMTMARELGSGERGFALAVADRLGVPLCDRKCVEQQAARLGVPESELEKIDAHFPDTFQQFRQGSVCQQYRDALAQCMQELARRGDVIFVGRGGNRFLQDHPAAFHVRLAAPTSTRVRRVMEHYWVGEAVARKRIVESDALRHRFYRACFGADWSSPLEYHLTVNTGRLGLTAVDLVVSASHCVWSRKREDAEG